MNPRGIRKDRGALPEAHFREKAGPIGTRKRKKNPINKPTAAKGEGSN